MRIASISCWREVSDRVIDLEGCEHARVAEMDARGTRRDPRQQHLRRRAPAEFERPVVLDRPPAVEACLVGEHGLIERLAEHARLVIREDRRGLLRLAEHVELHAALCSPLGMCAARTGARSTLARRPRRLCMQRGFVLPLATLSLMALLLPGCGGPIGPLSGGRLSGDVKPAPSDWGFAANVEQAQLETNPVKPRSVNVWIAVKDGALFLSSSMILGPKLPTERGWVRDVEADENVRLRIEGAVYELRARRVLDDAEVAAVRAALETKYELDAGDIDPDREVWVFQLEAR
jgi:hypothetical protein